METHCVNHTVTDHKRFDLHIRPDHNPVARIDFFNKRRLHAHLRKSFANQTAGKAARFNRRQFVPHADIVHQRADMVFMGMGQTQNRRRFNRLGHLAAVGIGAVKIVAHIGISRRKAGFIRSKQTAQIKHCPYGLAFFIGMPNDHAVAADTVPVHSADKFNLCSRFVDGNRRPVPLSHVFLIIFGHNALPNV